MLIWSRSRVFYDQLRSASAKVTGTSTIDFAQVTVDPSTGTITASDGQRCVDMASSFYQPLPPVPVTLTASSATLTFTHWSGGACDGQTTPTCTLTPHPGRNPSIWAIFR